jgi:hypothetical protein
MNLIKILENSGGKAEQREVQVSIAGPGRELQVIVLTAKVTR